jgi:hypothetical protein
VLGVDETGRNVRCGLIRGAPDHVTENLVGRDRVDEVAERTAVVRERRFSRANRSGVALRRDHDPLRLWRIGDLSGRSLRAPRDLAEIVTALKALHNSPMSALNSRVHERRARDYFLLVASMIESHFGGASP